MATKEQAELKIERAANACERVQADWYGAVDALASTISINGYGIHHDSCEMRNKLTRARASIDAALAELDRIDWPTKADYEASE